MIGKREEIDHGGHDRVLLNGAERVQHQERRDHEEEEKIGGQEEIGDLAIAHGALAECLAAEAAHASVRVDDLADYDERTDEHDERGKHHVEKHVDPF